MEVRRSIAAAPDETNQIASTNPPALLDRKPRHMRIERNVTLTYEMDSESFAAETEARVHRLISR